VPAAGFKRTDQSYLLDADPAATRDAAKVGGGDNTLPVGQWVNINGAGVKVVSQDPHGATIAFAPRLGPVVLPSQAPGAVTLPTFDSLGRDAGTSMVRWDAGSEPGIWYGISMNSGRPTISRHGGTAVRKGLGFSKAVTWNTVACSDSGCILGPRSTASASIEPLRMAVSLGPVPGDGIGTLTVSGYKASAALGWRIYWCNQRISGPACNPYSSGAHGETSLRPGNRAVTIDLLHHKVEYGGTMITAIAGAGAYRSADVYNVGLAVTRVGDLVTTRGFENASSSIIYDWGSYRL